MDHLPCPIDGSRPLVGFYAKRKVYTPDDFWKTPIDHGYEFGALMEHGLRPTMEAGDANTFLQEWLWFSLLARVVDGNIDSGEFYNNSHNLHTKNVLNEILEQWVLRDKQAGTDPIAQGRYIRASTALKDARRFLSKHLSYEPRDTDVRPAVWEEPKLGQKTGNSAHLAVDTTLTLSIAILGEILQRERQTLPHFNDRVQFWTDPETEVRNWGYSRYCRELLKSNGWCPSEIRRLESTMPGVCEVYYASAIKPVDGDTHVNCNIWECKATREPKGFLHMAACDGRCKGSVGILDEDIVKIIEDGKVPLVTWTASGELKCQGYDLGGKEKPRFGALSHSWAESIVNIGQDARGGNNRQIMPCQLDKMQEDFNRVINGNGHSARRENVPFWVDVLCFPRQAAAQTLALNQINNIYSNSAAVLVWDRNLLAKSKSAEKETIEMNVRIRLGDWSRRLWTLLEAVLAPKLFVAFKNDTLSFQEIKEARDRARNDLFHEYHHIWQAGHPFTEAIWKLRQLEDSAKPEFRPQRAWAAVQFHLVDEPENEAMILASLMKLDVMKLKKIGDLHDGREVVAAKRMVKLLNLMDTTPGLGIPSGIIFLPSPKLTVEGVPDTKGYKWAPRTWLSMQAHPYLLYKPLRKPGTMGKHGLLVEFPGLILHCLGAPIRKRKFWVPVDQDLHKWIKVVAQQEEKDWQAFSEQVCMGTEPIIIMSVPDPRDEWSIGVLVKTKGTLRDGQVLWVEILCRVWLRLETSPDVIKDLVAKFRENSDGMLFGSRLEQQEWCIDSGDT